MNDTLAAVEAAAAQFIRAKDAADADHRDAVKRDACFLALRIYSSRLAEYRRDVDKLWFKGAHAERCAWHAKIVEHALCLGW